MVSSAARRPEPDHPDRLCLRILLGTHARIFGAIEPELRRRVSRLFQCDRPRPWLQHYYHPRLEGESTRRIPRCRARLVLVRQVVQRERARRAYPAGRDGALDTRNRGHDVHVARRGAQPGLLAVRIPAFAKALRRDSVGQHHPRTAAGVQEQKRHEAGGGRDDERRRVVVSVHVVLERGQGPAVAPRARERVRGRLQGSWPQLLSDPRRPEHGVFDQPVARHDREGGSSFADPDLAESHSEHRAGHRRLVGSHLHYTKKLECVFFLLLFVWGDARRRLTCVKYLIRLESPPADRGSRQRHCVRLGPVCDYPLGVAGVSARRTCPVESIFACDYHLDRVGQSGAAARLDPRHALRFG